MISWSNTDLFHSHDLRLAASEKNTPVVFLPASRCCVCFNGLGFQHWWPHGASNTDLYGFNGLGRCRKPGEFVEIFWFWMCPSVGFFSAQTGKQLKYTATQRTPWTSRQFSARWRMLQSPWRLEVALHESPSWCFFFNVFFFFLASWAVLRWQFWDCSEHLVCASGIGRNDFQHDKQKTGYTNCMSHW